MKKILALMAGVALLFTSTIFTSCSDSDDDSSSGSSSSSKNGGSIVGVVLDNKGEPVEGATVTLGSKTATTNYGGEFEITGVSANDKGLMAAGSDVKTDATQSPVYKLTAKKDGYLSATVTGVYVTYQNTTNPDVATKKAYLDALRTDYETILEKYATDSLKPVANASLGGGGSSATTNTTQVAGSDSVVTTTTQTGSDSANVFKDISEAISALKNMYESGYYTEYFADFADFGATLVPCDASLKGKIKLNLKTQKGSTYAAETYIPKTQPTVHVSCAGRNTGTNDYTWETKADSNGYFSFDKNLPSGVTLTVTVDSFFEKIKVGDVENEYTFSSASQVVVDENSGAETAGALNTITLGSKDANVESIVLMLFAQNDKFWVTDTNVDSTASGVLLKTTDELTFTFNKPMIRAEFTGDKISNLKATEYTATWSEDKKTVTLKPVIGYWILTDASSKITITGEAEDGATNAVATAALTAYFDTKVWVSLKEESVSYKDYNDYIALDSAITLVFSKPMNDKVAVKLDNNSAAYTEAWNTDKTELTLTPVAKAKYWDVTAGKDIEITVDSDFASSKDYYNNSFGYWKTGAKDGKLVVYVDNFVDVEVAKAEVTGKEGFTVTFSKALKTFDAKTNITSVKAGTDAVTDYDAVIDASMKVVTITSKNASFNKKGFYEVTFADLKPVDGSKIFRKIGTTENTTSVLKYTTDFRFDGFEFKPTAIEVVDSIPTTAVESRAIVSVTTAKALKFTFNKEVQKSEITVKVTTETSPKNYIDSADKKVVYVPLDGVKEVNKAIVLGGTVTAVVDTVSGTTHSDQITLSGANLKDWFNNSVTDYYIYAALNLTGTSLVKGLDHVTGQPEYNKADPISAGGTVTFDFDADLTGYTASYKIFGLKDVDNDTAPADIKPLVENGNATVSGKTVTVTDAAFKSKKTVGDTATYYLELCVKNAAGVKVFSTTSPYFGSTTGSFEATAKTGTTDVYDEPGTGAEGLNNNKNYGSFIVEVAEKNILVKTNLLKETTAALSKTVYEKADALPAKSAITFEFSKDLTGASASYELYDLNTNAKKVIASGDATVAGKVVTVQNDLLVSGNPTVTGKTFGVVTADDTGISTYYLKLSVKDANGTVIFSTDNKYLQTTAPTGYTQTDFDKAVADIYVTSTATSKDMFKVEVAPLAVENLSFVDEKKDAFGNGLKEYEVKGINPKADLTLTFNAEIPATAKYTWELKDVTGTTYTVVDKSASAVSVGTATKTIKISSAKLIGTAGAEMKSYRLALKVVNGDDVLFDTTKDYFGKVNKYETAVADNAIGAIDNANDCFVVKVAPTQIVTKADANGVKSQTTTNDDKGFQKSFKSDIVLQFSHPVAGYTVRLYKTDKLFTATAKYKADNDVKDLPTTWQEVDVPNSKEALKLADFDKAVEYIYPSTQTISDDKKVITVKPAEYFGLAETVNIAVFTDDGDYIAVKNDNNADVTFKTLDDNDANKAKYAKELAAATGTELTVETLTTAATATDFNKPRVGDGQSVVFSIPTEISTKSDALPKYQFYVKNAEDTGYTLKTVTAYDGISDNKDETAGSLVTATNVILGRGTTSYFAYSLDAKAFGKRGGNVNVLLVKELDGKRTVFTKALSDVSAPKAITITAGTVSGTGTYSDIASIATGDLTTNGYTAGLITLATAKTAPAENGTSDPVEIADVKLTVKVGSTAQYIKDIKDIAFVSKGKSNNKASEGKAPKAAVYNDDSDAAYLTFTGLKLIVGDSISFKIVDTSGNEQPVTLTVKNAN